MRTIVYLLAFALLPMPAWAQGARLLIDDVDISSYEGSGAIRIRLDVLDRKNVAIPNLDVSKISIFVDNKPLGPKLTGKITLQTFQKSGMRMAVGILFTNYRGFIPQSSTEPNLFKHSKAGIVQLLLGLRPHKDIAGLWLYNESGVRLLTPVTGNIEAAIAEVRRQPDRGADGRAAAPNFYRSWHGAVRKLADMKLTPDRRPILVVVSDGIGEYLRKDRVSIKVRRIIDVAKDAGIRIYTFGAAMQGDSFLRYLAQAASETDGVYTKIAEASKLEPALRDLLPRLHQQYVVDLTAPGLGRKGSKGVKLRVEAVIPSGEKISAVYPRALQFSKVPPISDNKRADPKVTERLERIAARACACRESSCVTKLTEEMLAWAEKYEKKYGSPNKEQGKRIMAAFQKFAKCKTKAATAPRP